MFNSENRQAWQGLADQCAVNRPSVGKTVIINSGSTAGLVGKVFWHDFDKYKSTRNKSDASLTMMEMIGRHGFRVGIKTESGAVIFLNAEKVDVYYTVEQDQQKGSVQNG